MYIYYYILYYILYTYICTFTHDMRIKIPYSKRCILKFTRFISVGLMERARPHSPEVTVYGSPARVHGFSRIMRGYIYDIDYGNGGKQRGSIFVLRYDEIGIGARPILLPARSGMTPSAEL